MRIICRTITLFRAFLPFGVKGSILIPSVVRAMGAYISLPRAIEMYYCLRERGMATDSQIICFQQPLRSADWLLCITHMSGTGWEITEKRLSCSLWEANNLSLNDTSECCHYWYPANCQRFSSSCVCFFFVHKFVTNDYSNVLTTQILCHCVFYVQFIQPRASLAALCNSKPNFTWSISCVLRCPFRSKWILDKFLKCT